MKYVFLALFICSISFSQFFIGEKGYIYVVRPHDTLKGILRYHHLKNSLGMNYADYKKYVLSRNPLVAKTSKIRLGMRVFIPFKMIEKNVFADYGKIKFKINKKKIAKNNRLKIIKTLKKSHQNIDGFSRERILSLIWDDRDLSRYRAISSQGISETQIIDKPYHYNFQKTLKKLHRYSLD